MLVSLSIVSYNQERDIQKVLLSVLHQSYDSIEIFLVDNASVDKTVEIARATYKNSGSTRRLTLMQNKRNLGFGAGHNMAIARARGDAVLCLNDDCELSKNYVKYIVEVLHQHKNAAAAQGKLINPKTGKIDTTGLLIYKNRRVVNRGQGEQDRGQFEHAEEVWGVDGAAPMYRTAALEDIKVGAEYFDADFFTYKEDVDLSWRLRWAGWKLYYEPRAVGDHDRSAGEGIAENPWQIIQARRGISTLAKFHSFANQRLMQVKNETPYLFIKYAPYIVAKEFPAWFYVLLFERYGWKSLLEFFRLLPSMVRKRSRVMAKKRVADSEMEKWFV